MAWSSLTGQLGYDLRILGNRYSYQKYRIQLGLSLLYLLNASSFISSSHFPCLIALDSSIAACPDFCLPVYIYAARSLPLPLFFFQLSTHPRTVFFSHIPIYFHHLFSYFAIYLRLSAIYLSSILFLDTYRPLEAPHGWRLDRVQG